MAHFLTNLSAEIVNTDFGGGRGLWRVAKPLVYTSDVANRTITVPVGFETDFASVLRLPIMYSLFGDTAHGAATVHDYLYQTGMLPRATADAVFKEAIGASTKLSGVKRWLMWAAVRAFGGSHFGDTSTASI